MPHEREFSIPVLHFLLKGPVRVQEDRRKSCLVQPDLPCTGVLHEDDRVPCAVLLSKARSKRRLSRARTPKLFSRPARRSPRLRLRPRPHPEVDASQANTESGPICRTERQEQSHPHRTCAGSAPHHRRLILSHLNTTLLGRTDSSASIVPQRAVRGKAVRGTIRYAKARIVQPGEGEGKKKSVPRLPGVAGSCWWHPQDPLLSGPSPRRVCLQLPASHPGNPDSPLPDERSR